MQKPTRQQVIIGCVAGVAVAALGTLGVFAVLTGGFTHAAGQAPAQQSQQQSTQQSQQTTQKKDDSQAQSGQKKDGTTTQPTGQSSTPSSNQSTGQSSQGSQSQSTTTGDNQNTAPSQAQSAEDAAIAQATARGKMVATGTIACPTVAERAAQVDYSVPEFANDNSALTLLMLDSPMTVTAYFGGQDGHTGQVSSIALPNDEMYRRFNGQRVTIAVDNWGAFPSDIASKLYDIILGPRTGLELIYPA